MDVAYPPPPEAVPPGLTAPSPRFRRQAWLAEVTAEQEPALLDFVLRIGG